MNFIRHATKSIICASTMNAGKARFCARRATETDMTFVFQWWIAKRCIFPLPLASLASSSRRYLDGIGKLRSITFVLLPLPRLFMSCLLQVHLLARIYEESDEETDAMQELQKFDIKNHGRAS